MVDIAGSSSDWLHRAGRLQTFKSESRGVMRFVDLLRGGAGSVIAADGPAGPIYQAKPGPGFLAKKAGVTLVPLGAAISGGFQLDQWDRFEIPTPFARAVIVVGEPLTVPSGAKEEELERVRVALETEMNGCADERTKGYLENTHALCC